MVELDKVNYVFSNLSGVQLQVFKGLDGAQIQNYITQLQTIKASSNGLYAATPVAEYAKAIEGLEAKQAALLLSTQGLTNAQIAETLAVNESNAAKNYQAMADAGLLARKQKLTVEQVQENLQTVLGAEADTSAAMASLGLSAAMEGQGHQTVKLTARKLEEAVATNVLTEAQAKELAMRTGVMLSMEAQTASEMPKWIAMVKAGTKAVLGQVKATAKWLATTPAGWAAAAIASIGGVIAVINNLEKAEKKESDAAAELFEKSKEKVSSNKEEAESLEELIQKYQELKSASVIDSDAREQIKEIQNDIVGLVGSEAKTLDLVNGGLEEQLSRLKEISSEKARQNAEDAKDAYDNAVYKSNVMTGNADDYGNDVSLKWNGTESTQIHKVKGFEQAKYDDFVKFITDSGFDDIFRKNKDENIFNMRLVVDTTGIDGLEEKVERLKEFKEFLAENGFRNTGMYQGVANAISSYGEQQDSEAEAANNLVEAAAQSLSASSKELLKISVDSVKSFEEYRRKMLDEMKNDESIGQILADGTLSEESLEIAINDFMSTATQFSEWYEQWADNVKGDTFNDNKTSLSFEDAWASLAATDNDSLKSLKDDLLELAEAGQLTFETFNETEGSGDFLAQLGLTPDNISAIDDIISRINELKSSADQLASMKKGISPLSENLYSKQQEPDKEISVDVFAGMDEGLKNQKEEWENYVTVLGNASSSMEAVQNATNELATAYVNSNNFLANLTETNRDYYASQLSAMGVENAEEVVTASLSAQKEILAIKEQALAVTKDGVTASTAGEINALLNEANASETTRAYLFQLTAAEQVFNNQSLDTSGKIRALGELATAYGQTAIAAKIAAWEQAAADSHTQSSYSEADLKHLQEEMNANINSTKIDVNAYAGSAKSGGSGSGKSGKSGSSAKEESIETFDFIETAIKRIEAAIERLKTKAEETFRSFTSRGREYKKAISEITKEIEIQRQGYDAYIAKANSIGLEESWAGQVRDGSINIADISDDGLKERIKNYKEWWNHATLFSNG